MRYRVLRLVESDIFKNFIITLIILNGITMGLETSKELLTEYRGFFDWFNFIVITIFSIEIILRIYAHRLAFFKDGWSIFDFVIVLISLAPADAGFEILRILRVFRLFRLVSTVPQMRRIISALMSVIPGIASIAGLLSLFFYIFAIMATQLYGDEFPNWFGSLGKSLYTLFQIMTLESWSMGIVRPIMEHSPYAWLFFIPFIFIATFIIINLIIAIVVDAMNEMNTKEEKSIIKEIDTQEATTQQEIIKLREEIAELKELIIKQSQTNN